MTINNKRQAYRYNFIFDYTKAGLTYDDFIKVLPNLGLKKAAIAKASRGKLIIGELTLLKKLVIKSLNRKFWSVIPNWSKKEDSLLKISYSCDENNDIFESSNNIYYYPAQITKSASFVFAQVSNPRYAWQSDLDHIMLDSNKTQESRKVIHIWGSAGNEGKTAFIKHKLINSRIFGYFSPLFNASQTATALIAAGQKSYYFADIPRAIRETSHLFVMAEQLKDGIVVSAFYGQDRSLVYVTAVVVVFSNDLPPLHYLSKDRWEIYRINYDTAGASNLQQISKEDYASYSKEEARRVK